QPNNASTPNGSSGRQPSGSDPSIAKARAANIDTKVLGLSLGEPLRLPSCGPLLSLSVPTQTCVQQDLAEVPGVAAVVEALGMGSKQPSAEELRTNGLSVSFVPDACPAWMSECGASAMTYDGVLVAIDIKTKGHNVDQAVVRDLRAKYGPPTSIKPITVTPTVGNPFKANNLEWLLPGLHVVYEVVLKGQNEGEVANVELGDIGFETEAAYQRRLAKEKAKPKPKL
ncbi:MAG TPA: hypothetical protein VLE19_05565, partial [Pyrinomonadaceae bacterium]|nr:hypothetical protein [Pyrinomonadaceae bacterium]